MNWKRLLSNALLVTMILGFTSCFDDEEEAFSIEADVYYINKLVDGEWMHGTTYYVYGNESMSSAKVTTPVTSETIELEAAAAYYNVMVSSPAQEDYSVNTPEEGNFQFEATNQKGEILYSTDEQEFVNLEGAKIDSIGFDSNNFLMYVAWNEIEESDGYYLKMYDSSDELVFEGYGVGSDETEFIISEYYSTGNWIQDPVEGDDYQLLLQTFVYDDDATNSNLAYNIKEVTVTDTMINWDF
ncbi:hypothetical protein GM418_15540 [Maribellus comscasis]|uniref:Uncharacterized protein n=1 Tax=Maribellus comscasis TaxID=2681766 RepID=A0A6I6K4V3_9BACT|nr:hypothetical protein [Maribellus comscasis]QGY45034.1 hypothetical protein GM418_15540 [Maribellus comscasis]